MTTTEYLNFIVQEIHTTVMATVDEDGLPVTAAVDMMDSDERGLYFLTARGKSLYERLCDQEYLAFTGIKGESTMKSVAVSVRGRVREIGAKRIPELFEKNPYMREIYPTQESMDALTVFHIYEGSGEWFDLSKKPIERASFVFGKKQKARQMGYVVTDECFMCGCCVEECPQECISPGPHGIMVIHQEHCLHCGLCAEGCPMEAIERRWL